MTKNNMIISISEASKQFKVSRAKLYRMKDSGQISLTKKPDGKTGFDLSELLRVFGGNEIEHQNETKRDNLNNPNHDLATENFYLKKEVEFLTSRLQRSESQVDQLIASTQEKTKQLFLTQTQSPKSFWHRLWRK